MKFIVTTHAHLAGVFLSRPGHWGNLPFPGIAEARAAAEVAAGSADVSIEQVAVRSRRIVVDRTRSRGA